jgi:hypothetical protein
MTPLAQAVAALPEQKLILMVRILVTQQIAELVSDKKAVVNKKEEVEKMRNLEVVQLLPEEDKQRVFEMCDKALEIFELMNK